jgi:cysteine-rich repeat protein
MMRRGAVAGILTLGGCVEENPVFIDTTTGTGATTDVATTADATTAGDGSSAEPTSADATAAETTAMTGVPGYCGDGRLDPGEECDDGDDDSLNACSNECTYAGCGDGDVQAGEACDDGNFDDNDACLDSCELAQCGDGKVWLGAEACDDGNPSDNDGCLGDCTLAKCGDGVLNEGVEDCDDGNDANTDDCLNSCVPAVCGDGVLWAGVEECDDGNDDPGDTCDGCKLPALPFRFVFMTSKDYSGAMGGLAGADGECQSLAKSAKLPGTYLAWLGDQKEPPAVRMKKADVPYIRTDFKIVALNWTDLTDGDLAAPIDRTELGQMGAVGPGNCNGGSPVHTNITKDGALYDPKNNCNDWNGMAGSSKGGMLGPPGQINGLWTTACLISCAVKTPIYCIQQ